MLVYVTDSLNGNNPIAINVDMVVAVYKIPEDEHKGKTCVSLVNGYTITEMPEREVVELINGAKS